MSQKMIDSIMGARPDMTDPAIVVEDLRVTFGSRQILKGISFAVPRGQTLAIMGLSGSGKSTTLRCLIGLLKPAGGRILINNENPFELEPKELNELRKRIGMAFQHGALFDSLTIGENVAFGLREHTQLPEEEIQRIVVEKLAQMDMEGLDHLYPSEVSGGMAKRASFARTVATQPDVVLYDEPTSGLDPIISRVIYDLMLNIQRQLKATSVVVTHDPAGATLVGQQILMLHQGHVVWIGPAQEFETTDNPYIVQLREGRVDGPIRV